MKHFRIILFIAALVVSISAAAEDASSRVTVTKQLDGTTVATGGGTVGVSVSGSNVQLTVTPDNGNYFETADLTVRKYIDAGHAQTRGFAGPVTPGYDETVTVTAGSGNTLTGTSTFTFAIDDDANILYDVTTNFHTQTSIATATVTVNGGPWTYSGTAIKPGVTVTLGSATLSTTDYEVAYTNNVNAGEGEITVTGVGKYTGNPAVAKFAISPKSIEGVTIILSPESFIFNGGNQKPDVVVKDGETTLVEGTDYTLTNGGGTNIGEYSVTVTGKSNYDSQTSAVKKYVISDKAVTLVVALANPNETIVYDGTEKKPALKVTDGTTELGSNDYDVVYTNNINAGTMAAKATVTLKGNYSGSGSVNFTINKAQGVVTFSPYKFTKTYGDPDFTIRPSVTGNGSLRYSSDNKSVATVNANTGKVSIKGIGKVKITATMSSSKNYTGDSDWYEVTINPKQTSITIGAKGIATYCGTEPLDFTGNKNLEAYTVIGCSYNTNTIWMSRVYKVPAETPIVIKGAEGSYTLDCATRSASYYKNKLVGNLSGSVIKVNETEENDNGELLRNLYLKEGTFKKVKNYAYIDNGKAYLQLPANTPAEKGGNTQSIKLSSTGKSTLCSDVDLDFSGVDGLKAYVVTGYDKDTKTFWLNRVLEASAGTPLYLVGSANTSYSIPSKGIQTAFEDMLVGNTSGSTIKVNETEEDASGELLRNLYLKDGTFKLVKNFANIANGKCYLQAPATVVAAMARGMEDPDFTFILNDEMMSIGFSDFDDDSQTTGIMSVEKDYTSDVIYDLQGRRVIAPKKGIYIRNGRKVVLK